MKLLEGKVAIVTGASRGIGAAIVLKLAEHGANVAFTYVSDSSAEKASALENQLQGLGIKAKAYKSDAGDYAACETFVNDVVKEFGKIDVCVNNAGISKDNLLLRVSADEWDKMIDVNLKGVLNGIAAVLPYMKQQKSGQIINTSSVAGHKVFNGSAVYSATKFAVRALTEGLRMEVKPYNIRTTIVCPGAVKTELLEQITDADVRQANEDYVGAVGISPDSFARVVAFAISQPEDVDINEIIFRPTSQEM